MMMALSRYNHSLFFALGILLSFLSQYGWCSLLAPHEGFSIELIHRDSPRSPHFNETETRDQRISNGITRSVLWFKDIANHGDSEGEPFSRLRLHNAEYLMNISIGTPPTPIVGYLGIACSLIWTQCQPCPNCPKQIDPIFDPRRSSTYQDVSCFSRECSWFGDAHCDPVEGRICQDDYGLLDGTYFRGNIGKDIVDLDRTSGGRVSFNHIIFGCGHANTFYSGYDGAYSGIIGLASGPMSLLSQLGEVAAGKFSHCLLPFLSSMMEKSSKLNFGRKALVSGVGTVCSPLVLKTDIYHLTITGITVARNNIVNSKDYLAFPTNEAGNIRIDAGTILTFLQEDFYDRLETIVMRRIKLARVPSPVKHLHLCYRSMTERDAPTLYIHFKNADVKLGFNNIFWEIIIDVWCFAFAPAGGPFTPRYNAEPMPQIYGAFQQTNFLIGYDIPRKVVCFKPASCIDV